MAVNIDIKLICEMVRFHRKEAGLSQQELAIFSGIGKTAVFDIEKGSLSVRLTTLLRVLNILNIKIEFSGPLLSKFQKKLDEKSQITQSV